MRLGRVLASGFLCFLMTNGACAQNDLGRFRRLFHEATKKKHLEAIIQMKLEACESANANVYYAYKAASVVRLAKYVINPLSKLKYFKSGTNLLDEIIRKDTHLEIIYIRLLIQLSVPSFLNYHAAIEDDLSFIRNHLRYSDLDFEDRELFKNSLYRAAKNDYLRDNIRLIKTGAEMDESN